MTPRDRRRLIQRLVWPMTLLAVGLGLILAAFALAASTGLTVRLYGVFQGVGELVILIGGGWLLVVLIKIAIDRARRPRP